LHFLPPFGGLEAAYNVHLRIIGKRVGLVDFLLVTTELFFATFYIWCELARERKGCESLWQLITDYCLVHTADRQDCLILSAVWTELVNGDSRRQFSVVLSSAVSTHLWTGLDPVSKYDVTIGNHAANWKLETGSGQDKDAVHTTFQDCTKLFRIQNFQSPTVLTCCQFSSHHGRWQDSLVLLMSAVWTRHNSLTQCEVNL